MNGIAPNKMDWVLTTVILLLLSISIIFIYSAQFMESGLTGSFWIRQLIFSGLGFLIYLITSWINYRKIIRWSIWIYLGSLILLLVVFLFPAVNGAHRWINLPGFTIQPSELAKISSIIMLSSFLSAPDRDLQKITTFVYCIGIILIPILLIALEPDLSSAIMLIPASIALLLYAGIQRKFITITSTFLLIMILILCLWIKYEKPTNTSENDADRLSLPTVPFMEEYQKNRIRVFLSDDYEPGNEGWNKLQAQVAVGSGGLRGKGYLKGTQNILGFLPRTVAPTDFIFCVIAEETGFAGSIIIIALYGTLLSRCLRTAWRAIDEFGRMIALGISVLFFSHIFVNIAMTIGLLPITGLPLPIMSYGGSFMLSTMAALGIIQSIYQRRLMR